MRLQLLLLMTLLPFLIFSQDGYGYNVLSNPIQTNPAFTGVFNDGILNVNRRRTWLQHTDFYNVNYQTHLNKINSGIGVNYTNQSIFSMKLHATTLSYAYQNKLTDQLTWSAGVSATFNDYRGAQIWDEFGPTGGTTGTISDRFLSTGALLYHKRFFIAVSLSNIQSNSNRPPLFKAIYGHRFTVGRTKNLVVTPHVICTYEGKQAGVIFRVNTNYKNFKTIVGMGTRDLAEFGIGYNFKRISLQYQFRYGFASNSFGNNINRAINHFNFQIRLPQSVRTNTKAFDFNLF